MKKIALAARRADAFCARLNDGLAAVAIVLAVLTTATLIERLPSVPTLTDVESGLSSGF